jgi:hypothetical protein
MIGEDRSTRRKTYFSATLSTTNSTWTDPGPNPGLRGKRPATVIRGRVRNIRIYLCKGSLWHSVIVMDWLCQQSILICVYKQEERWSG